MDNTESTQKGRHHCKFSGCDKSFQRREHLARHTRTHSELKHVCQVCQKEFTRSDSLQRHLGLHGESFKPSPSQRSKHACVTCHASKIKCNGEQPCSRCHNKGIHCCYDQADPSVQKEASQNSPLAPVQFGYRISTEGNDENSVSHHLKTNVATSGNQTADKQVSFEERLSAALNKNKGPIDWASAKVQNDAPQGSSRDYRRAPHEVNKTNSEGDKWPSLSGSETAKFLKLYLAHFHHRWPILHAPTFETDTASPVLRSCVIMIGACIHGTSDSKELAIGFHTRVSHYIFPRLGQLSSEDNLDHSPTLALCEASLLFIIFSFYCGKETILPKAIMMRSMLITGLREMGLFNSELPVSYDKPGYFVPLRLVKEAQRQRLSTCLFKIDSYLAVLRGQPQFLMPEELFFNLPSTFALWNAKGLDIWQIRHSIEPESRAQNTIYHIIRQPALELFTPNEGLMLIEDIQLGICAMHSKVWHLWERIRGSSDEEISNDVERDALKRRLDTWKHLIVQIPIQQTDHIDFSQEQHLAMRYYYGIEDHSDPGWQLIVFERPKNLILDTLMLYHLLSLHLFTDIRTLTQIANDSHPANPECVSGGIYLKAKERREESTRTWTKSAAVRRALTHAADILVSYNSVSGLENNRIDPIAFVALSVSALVVWAYCMHSDNVCPDCVSEGQILPFFDASVVELTKWSGPETSQVFENNRETWIELGGCPGALTGLLLCRCNIDVLMAKFCDCIRQGWNVADTIAPGIFKLES